MGKIYSKFNRYIKEKYFHPSKRGETIILAVDESTIMDFCSKYNIDLETFKAMIKEDINSYWETYYRNDKIFGMCAIQVYVAHQMRNEEDYSAREYNPRLARLLEMKTSKLQNRYRKYQKNIWEKLRNEASKIYCNINIPTPHNSNRKYVNYPLSQTFLNKADLDEIPKLFENVGLKYQEQISFDEFKKLIEGADSNIKISRHYEKVKERLLKNFGSDLQIKHQIYDYYINIWDGYYPKKQEYNQSSIKQATQENSTFTIVLDVDLETITVKNERTDAEAELLVSEDNLFTKLASNGKLFNNNILVFEYDPEYEEWNYERFMRVGETYLIITNSIFNIKEIETVSSIPIENHSNEFYGIFKISNVETLPKYHFSELFSKEKIPYHFEGGLKLGKKVWLTGCGPRVIIEEYTNIWLNGEAIDDLDFTQLSTGKYKLKIDFHLPTSFEIQQPKRRESIINFGWEINTQSWHPSTNDINISGNYYNFPNQITITTDRIWIDTLLHSKKGKTKSQVLKAIRRSNYGV